MLSRNLVLDRGYATLDVVHLAVLRSTGARIWVSTMIRGAYPGRHDALLPPTFVITSQSPKW